MAAYAALVSLEHIINNLQLHPRPPISLRDDEQTYPLTKRNKLIASLKNLLSSKPRHISLHKEQVHLLTEKITFLQQFLEVYNPNLEYSKEADPLESRIARAAYAAEDAMESHILYQFTNNDGENMSSKSLYKALKEVIEDMALIEKEAMEIKETMGFQNQLQAKSTTPADSFKSSSSPIAHKSISMVGADGVLLEMKEKLAYGRRELQTIPIVGMGGSGKTTLALNIYQDRLIEDLFYIRAWVTISQEYNIREIIIQLLTELISEPDKGLSEEELGEMLYKHLFGRKFMITLDDMWSVKAWDRVRSFFPDNNNGSRVVVTTRLTSVASALPNSNILGMKLLNENDSWDLLSKTVFGEKSCPPELEKIGKKIGKNCKGLPLSIIVVGGLLAKSKQTKESWEHMEKNLNAIVNLDDDERCLKTLYVSYKQLPIHLKPCFLYMGIYREDHTIRIPDLIKLWVAEGFLKPVNGKRPEDIARVYLNNLIDRNLILIHELGSIGSIKYCKIHDLLRDLCLREAQKEGFYIVYPGEEIGNRVDRIVMSGTMPEIKKGPLSSAPRARSLILDLQINRDPQIQIIRLMRIVGTYTSAYNFIGNVPLLVNSRFISFGMANFPSLMWLFWNLQILKVFQIDYNFIAPADIWYMSNLRHLYFQNLYLVDHPNAPQDIVLENLQTLGNVHDFTCSEQVVKRIPNIKKLHITYDMGFDDKSCLINLDCLDKLESLFFYLQRSMMRVNYPRSLKKLTVQVNQSQYWEDILDKIGDLPLLQKLKLILGTFKEQWETTEGQFCSLKFLSLKSCDGLKVWTSEASHFPRLEQLHLSQLGDLEEIPSDFAEIPTLRVIDITYCNDSTIESAKRILEEQEALYGEEETTLQIQVILSEGNDPALKSFKRPNFHVKYLR